MERVAILFISLLLMGCDQPTPPEEPSAPAEETTPEATAPASAEAEPATDTSDRLDEVLSAQPSEAQERYEHRNPKETLEFFGIEPGMTVVEVLPGGGWYSQILVPYLGSEGRLIGANYARDLWPKFGMSNQDFLDSMETWVDDWPEQAREWQGDDGAEVDAFELGSLPESMEGQADAVLAIRALHNLARFEGEGGYLGAALSDLHRALKPGGIAGVVQHEARPDMPDDWASGANGYLKKQFVIDRMTEAGFELVEESDVNENPADQPSAEDVVWRLPPSYATSGEDPELRAEMEAIGESNRMTLKFRKPAN